MLMARRIALAAGLLSFCLFAHAAGSLSGNDTVLVSLSDLALKADLVAVVQVADTDYVYTRDFPSEGSAYLKVLIPYKPGEPREDIIEVYEKGLHPYECYFENPTVFEEGRRYLGFFRRNPEDPESYTGLAEGCALEILVTSENSYALRLPLDGFELDSTLQQHAEALEFRDRYAVLEEDAISPERRNELLERGLLIFYGDGYKYTRGIDLTTARKLLNEATPEPR
jgi:hypothetical protein